MPLYEPIEVPKIQRIDSPNGRRYKTPGGSLYPSVTTIFSVYDNKHIQEWKEKVGEEQANKIANAAAKRGTYIHERCEELIKGINITQAPFAKMLYWDQWLNFKPLVEQIGKVYANEAPLFSDYLQVAGTVDCVGEWQGKRSIIDFKTSSRYKAKEDIETYWMQCAAYAVMWEERTGMPITNLVILMSVEDDHPLCYNSHRDEWIHKFIDLRKEFRNKFGD